MPQFDPILGFYAPEVPWVPSIAHIIRRAAILDAIQDKPIGRVLEIGCGGGAFLRDLSNKGFYGKGVDTSETALKVAKYFHVDNENTICIAQSGSVNVYGIVSRNSFGWRPFNLAWSITLSACQWEIPREAR